MYRPPREYYVSSSCSLCLNKSAVDEDIINSGRLFQILIDEG